MPGRPCFLGCRSQFPVCFLQLQYYDDAAGILRSIILSAIAPHRLATAPPQLPMSSANSAKDDAMMLAERQATEEPNFLPYAAMDSSDEVDDRWTSHLLAQCSTWSKIEYLSRGFYTPQPGSYLYFCKSLSVLQEFPRSKGKHCICRVPGLSLKGTENKILWVVVCTQLCNVVTQAL